MKNRILFIAISGIVNILFLTTSSVAQDNNSTNKNVDICHVYIVDTKKALKFDELYLESAKPEADENLIKLKKEIETDFPEFKTLIGEEELTTKHYNFPNSDLIITASVYYTDESMGFTKPNGNFLADSMLIGISVSNKRSISSIGFPPINNAVSEVIYDENTNLVRVKQYVKVKGRVYLVGLECDCAAKRQKKKEENK